MERMGSYMSVAHDIFAVYENHTATLETLRAILSVRDLHRHAALYNVRTIRCVNLTRVLFVTENKRDRTYGREDSK